MSKKRNKPSALESKGNGFFSIPTAKSFFTTVAITSAASCFFAQGTNFVSMFNDMAAGDTASSERDIIRVNDVEGSTIAYTRHYTLVSSDYIAENHSIPYYIPFTAGHLGIGNLYFDLDKDDSFTQALKTLETDMIDMAQEIINNDPVLSAQLQQENWTYDEHMLWQQRVMDRVLDLTCTYPGLGRYTSDDDAVKPEILGFIKRRSLNHLSEDINNNSEVYELDCEQKSVIDNFLAHKINEHFLSETQQPKMFYVTSDLTPLEDPVGHAFNIIVDPESDRIIGMLEGTYDVGKFRTIANDDLTLEEYINGEPILAHSGTVLGMNFDQDDVDRLRSEHIFWWFSSSNDTQSPPPPSLGL